MNDNIDKNEIRRAIDRLQEEHPAHFTFDITMFDNGTDFTGIQRVIDVVAKKCQDDADIYIICEMAKLYLEGVRPMVMQKQEWIPCDERLPDEHGYYIVQTDGSHNAVIDIAEYGKFFRKPEYECVWEWNKASKIIAWMPLPEPYKKEGEKNEEN